MQVNEFVGQVQQGTRLPDRDRAFNDGCAAIETREERRDAAESRRTSIKLGTTRMPRRYGAGF